MKATKNGKTRKTPTHCACGRFTRRGAAQCIKCADAVVAAPEAPLAPATSADLWVPSARWLAPSAADRALARSVVDAADRAWVEAGQAVERAREAAELRSANAATAIADAQRPRRDWLGVVGAALCVSPVVGLVVWVVAHL